MTLRVVGAGLGRTGTHSLKVAFEQLLGAPCYHMVEVFGRPDQRETWRAAAMGDDIDWKEFLATYSATVDWPAAAFWKELAAAFPDAVIVLSTRSSSEAWWTSAHETIFALLARGAKPDDEGGVAEFEMIDTMLQRRFTPNLQDHDEVIAAYEAHNAEVRSTAPADRLVEWQPGDGWEPLCAALKLPVPAEPFPHLNSKSEFRMMTGLDGPAPA